MPNEANHHTDRQISLIRDPKANTKERGVGKSFSLEEKHRGLNRKSAIKKRHYNKKIKIKTEMLLINS